MRFLKILFLTIIVSVYVILYSDELYENYNVCLKTRNLEKDGFCVLYKPEYLTNNHKQISD